MMVASLVLCTSWLPRGIVNVTATVKNKWENTQLVSQVLRREKTLF